MWVLEACGSEQISPVLISPQFPIIAFPVSLHLSLLPQMAHLLSEPQTIHPKHTFIRSYQACVPCRKRKVKCDLGDPGNPSDPPCRRCRREHKDCYFQDLRTKKSDPGGTQEGGRFVKRNRKTKSSASPDAVSSSADPSSTFHHLSASVSGPVPSISPADSTTADRILHKEVHNASEALNLLYEAAAESRAESENPSLTQIPLDSQFSERLKIKTIAWRDFWCVKAGWMTDVEARTYVDLSGSATIRAHILVSSTI